MQNPQSEITLALSKGKLFEPAIKLLQHAGLVRDVMLFNSRRLRFESDTQESFRFLLVKNSDVPTYVEYGIADAGIAGLDVLLESGAEVDAPLNLKIGHCRIAVAGRPEDAGKGYILQSQLRVATKYPRLTRDYFAGRGAQVEIIKLDGSVELAAVVGLADRIVDLVETGETLRQNGLMVHEIIGESTGRLIVNKASHKLKLAQINELIARLRKAVNENSAS